MELDRFEKRCDLSDYSQSDVFYSGSKSASQLVSFDYTVLFGLPSGGGEADDTTVRVDQAVQENAVFSIHPEHPKKKRHVPAALFCIRLIRTQHSSVEQRSSLSLAKCASRIDYAI